MIPRADIVEWRSTAPWISDAQIEQDLLLCRSIVELFSHNSLKGKIAFRGGTALHKLYMSPAQRYSEDIDLVQVKAGPAGPLMDAIQEALNPFLGGPQWDNKENSLNMTYRVQSELPPVMTLHLKVEVNTREHFTVQGLRQLPFSVASRWFTGECVVTTYSLDELLGTKLRALCQRRKGRDLFDLWLGLKQKNVEPGAIVSAFHAYLHAHGLSVTKTDFVANMTEKMKRKDFLSDTSPILRPGLEYNPKEAWIKIRDDVLSLLNGE